MSDPACFAPVIKYVKSIAEKMNQDAVVNNYVVLLIITDGGITGETIENQVQFRIQSDGLFLFYKTSI